MPALPPPELSVRLVPGGGVEGVSGDRAGPAEHARVEAGEGRGGAVAGGVIGVDCERVAGAAGEAGEVEAVVALVPAGARSR